MEKSFKTQKEAKEFARELPETGVLEDAISIWELKQTGNEYIYVVVWEDYEAFKTGKA